MRSLAIATVLSAAAAAAGCTIGSGTGSAVGNIWVLGCSNTQANFGADGSAPPDGIGAPYSLRPSFFAGEPIEDIGPGEQQNALTIRMQRLGGATETDDSLYFDIQNSFEVARCVRGRTVNGQPDWSLDYKGTGPWCDWTAAAQVDGGLSVDAAAADGSAFGVADGGVTMTARYPAIRLSPAGVINAGLAMDATCPTARLTAQVIDGWIQFLDFGSATQADVPSDQRTPIGSDFKVNFGERLRAVFTMVLGDQSVIYAELNHLAQVPDPRIGGYLEGSFDFTFQRGRAAQVFP
jgi:hypothetical protein